MPEGGANYLRWFEVLALVGQCKTNLVSVTTCDMPQTDESMVQSSEMSPEVSTHSLFRLLQFL